MIEQFRPQFEKWALDNGYDLITHDGEYYHSVTRWAFEAWMAAISSVVVYRGDKNNE